MEGRRRGRRWRLLLILGGIALPTLTVAGLGLAYLFAVVLDQPLTTGSWMGAVPAQQVQGPYPGDSAYVVDYVDGQTVTVDFAVRNQGRFGLTVTGVHTHADLSGALSRIVDARPAVMRGPSPCCIVDTAATWAAPSFRPMHLDPGKEGTLALHIVLSHCHDNGVGIYNIYKTVTVDYDVLGYHHTTDVPLQEPLVVHYMTADVCP